MDENNQIVVRRNDSFDVEPTQPGQGQTQQIPVRQNSSQDVLIQAMSNPTEFIESMGLSDQQAQNLRALLTGGGAALATKYLGDALSEPVAGALGAILGGIVSQKVVKKGRKKIVYTYGNREVLREDQYFGGI